MSDQASITELVHNFAGACRALVPHLDQAGIPWADGKQYDNWDRISEALYESLVLEPCCSQAEIELRRRLSLARYGYSPDDENAFLCFDPDGKVESRFIQLRSVERPFDSFEGMENGERKIRPIADLNLIFVTVAADGTRHKIESIRLEPQSPFIPVGRNGSL